MHRASAQGCTPGAPGARWDYGRVVLGSVRYLLMLRGTELTGGAPFARGTCKCLCNFHPLLGYGAGNVQVRIGYMASLGYH